MQLQYTTSKKVFLFTYHPTYIIQYDEEGIDPWRADPFPDITSEDYGIPTMRY